MADNFIWTTGRRKESVARVRLKPGTGQVTVNGRKSLDYFCRPVLQLIIDQPLELTEQLGKVDIIANCSGGGLSGQAGALRHGITRALCKLNPELRGPLKAAGMVTRDPRAKERKKYGLHGARRGFQFSKR